MTTDTLKITCVNGTQVREPKHQDQYHFTMAKIPVSVGIDKQLTVDGTGFTEGVVGCTLVRLGMARKGKLSDTIWKVTRFISSPSKDGCWSVKFDVQDLAVYLLSCHSTTSENDYVEVTLTNFEEVEGPRREITLTGSYQAPNIVAKGSVFNPGNAVTCSLTAVDCTTGVPIAGGLNQNAAATFVPPTQKITWQASFAPPPGTMFSGCYLLEASAASEGPISTPVTVP